MRKIQSRKNWKDIKVLLRLDLNVPIANGRVLDDTRIRAAMPTIKWLSKKGAIVIILAHLGRPDGRKKKELSLKPVVDHLSQLVGDRIAFLTTPIGRGLLSNQLSVLESGRVVVLENIRFYKGEKGNDPDFAKKLSKLGQVFVNDGFAVSHRKSASVVGVAEHLKSYAGLRVQDEVRAMKKVIVPKSPSILIIGGIKIETKLPVIRSLLPKFDAVLVSGGVFNTILAAKGYLVGASRVDKEYFKEAKWLAKQKKVITPIDAVLGTRDCKKLQQIPIPKEKGILGEPPLEIMDMGPATIALFEEYISKAKTIVWNGPVGYAEESCYRVGTDALGKAVGKRAKKGAFVLVGGGETVEALKRSRMLQYITHASTGGGAMLDYLSRKKLPGLEIL